MPTGLTTTVQIQPMKMPKNPLAAKKSPALSISDEFSVAPKAHMPVAKPVLSAGVSKDQLNAALDGLAVKLQMMNQQQLQGVSNKIDTHYNRLTNQNQQLSDKVADLQTEVSGLKRQAIASHKNIAQLKSKVSDIVNGYVGSFNANGAATYKAVPRPEKVKPVNNVVTYVVQAVVPGRAWLYGTNGQTISVGVGDQVKGYGRIMSINSLNGTVTLNNGTVLSPGA